ncbi:MAG: peptide chain release factor 2 [Deltaproteobacteria bacterium]|nr:peptide chain release factor 2 [Deltaproteobacteria bacterium]MBI3077806.1 peptide chain release factor 2 [Deltaproteobacteria bacterium]
MASSGSRRDSSSSGGIFDLGGKRDRLQAIEAEGHKEDFWKDSDRAAQLLRERTAIENVLAWAREQGRRLEECRILADLMQEEEDLATLEELRQELEALEAEVDRVELEQVLSGEHDGRNAIVSIHAGAGGTEACDWATMLLRMYLRWAERRGYKTEVLDYQPGEEAGVRSVTFTASGKYAYGYLKSESGIHRLVRISPFDASSRRHTSFASVFIFPELADDIVVEINEADLKVDTYRASGAGGQYVNKTDSAVRITHLPTGIVVSCQNERSQHKNRAMAMKILRARLYELQREEQQRKLEEFHAGKKEIAWGSQIRSYILHPYRLIKDHRTNLEVGNVDAVLDGELEPFIEAYLFGPRARA